MAGARNAAVLNSLRDVLLTRPRHSRYAASSHLLWFSNKKATAEVAGRKTGGCFWVAGKATLISDTASTGKIQIRLYFIELQEFIF